MSKRNRKGLPSGDRLQEPAESDRASRELRRQRVVLQHIIDNVPHMIFWKDRNSVYLGANQTKLHILGLETPEQLAGMTDDHTGVSREDAEYYRKIDREVMSTGQPILNLEEGQHGNRGDRVLLTSKSPLRDEEGSVIGITGICIDITERKRMELELERAKAAAEALANARGEFLSKMSHELRTPLTLIRGPLESILSGEAGEVPARILGDLARVQRNADRLFTLVNDILDFTRLEAGEMQIHRELVDTVKVVAAILDDTRWLAEQKAMQIRFSSQKGLGLIPLDRAKFETIAVNLVGNALKFTPPYGTIDVGLRSVAGELELSVADTGPGIPREKQQLIFEKFQQVDPLSALSLEGTGIGLALVRGLAELLGGNVSVQSTIGKGSRFVVRLPTPPQPLLAVEKTAAREVSWFRPPSPNLDVPGVPVAANAPADGGPSNLGVAGERAAVVIAEDNADMRNYMRDILADRYDVEAVANGHQALAAIRRRQPVVVVSDVTMPEMDGYQLVSALKADSELRQVPVILVTAKASREEVVSGLDIGADDYLSKPFGPSELRARVRAAERQRRTYQELADKHRELAAAMEKLHETQNELVQAGKMAALGTLVAGMSHELNNPVATILMHAQSLLGRVGEGTPWRASVEAIERQALRSGRLIRMLLDFSRSKPSTTLPISISDLIAHVSELVGAQLHGSHVALKVASVEGGLPIIEASTQELEVALFNLIKNGLEAAAPNGQVWIRACRRDQPEREGVEILVGDTGPGIAPDILPQIFDPFFTTKPVGEGIGLGLALARRIVESHGGQIRAESQVGVGTTMRVWLPGLGRLAGPPRT